MNNQDGEKQLVKHLSDLLHAKGAHASFEHAVSGLAAELRGIVPDKLPYSIWQIVEHIRITQWDMLEFSRNPKHKSPNWPDEYWPKEIAPADNHAWEKAIKQIKEDTETFINLLHHKDSDLYEPFAWGDGQNLLKEAMQIADHTSYHTGEIIVIRRLLDAWK